MENIEWIKEQVANILRFDGPDGHIDGYEEIADFIKALLEGNGKEWVELYNTSVEEENEKNWKDVVRRYCPLTIEEAIAQPPLQKDVLSKSFIESINSIEDKLSK